LGSESPTACVGISHYWLGFTSVLADNVAKNLVGVGFASVFRFWAYRRFVFTEFTDPLTHGRIVPVPAPE